MGEVRSLSLWHFWYQGRKEGGEPGQGGVQPPPCWGMGLLGSSPRRGCTGTRRGLARGPGWRGRCSLGTNWGGGRSIPFSPGSPHCLFLHTPPRRFLPLLFSSLTPLQPAPPPRSSPSPFPCLPPTSVPLPAPWPALQPPAVPPPWAAFLFPPPGSQPSPPPSQPAFLPLTGSRLPTILPGPPLLSLSLTQSLPLSPFFPSSRPLFPPSPAGERGHTLPLQPPPRAGGLGSAPSAGAAAILQDAREGAASRQWKQCIFYEAPAPPRPPGNLTLTRH